MSTAEVRNLAPGRKQFLSDVLQGLRKRPRSLPCKYFYDEAGSQLFDRICDLDEYYLTRTELQIMQSEIADIASAIGPRSALVEYGSGSSLKTRILLENLIEPAAYVPVDISREHLRSTAQGLSRRYPHLTIIPVCADFTGEVELPALPFNAERTIVYFPGSTIGNFELEAAASLLAGMAAVAGADGAVLIGVDLIKDRATLEAAYDDAAGVTREFNRNLLHRVNRELDGDLRVASFEHVAFFNDALGRIEIYLESLCDQSATIHGHEFHFQAGERIHTENSHKYTLSRFRSMAQAAGLQVETVWCDPQKLFSVQYLTAG